MKVIDNHCDVLCKMLRKGAIDFNSSKELDVTLPRLKDANMLLQCFAIYIPEEFGTANFHHILSSVELFYTKILSNHEILFIRSKEDLISACNEQKIGALLSLEGVDGLGGNLSYLSILFYLGLRSLGITWNYANWAGDGVLEPRQGGLSKKGQLLVQECNKLGIIVDVSHLTENGFWDVVKVAKRPFVATHSNAFEICNHVRNLKKSQIEWMIQSGGRIGITFVPSFVDITTTISVAQILAHIDYICSLGGVGSIGFGSDFDGIDRKVFQLEHTGKYPQLVNELLKRYKQAEVEGFLHENWYRFYLNQLPQQSELV